MLSTGFLPDGARSLTLLCIGAHSDDLEIGCGGTILRILREYPGAKVCWVVLAANGVRAAEARLSAGKLLSNAGHSELMLEEFRDGYFPYLGGEIKDFFESLKQRCSPDLILTHCRHDLHQDHRLVCELTWNTFRSHLILEYEIVKYDADLASPNFFVPLDDSIVRTKMDVLMECFPSQMNKHWFDEETFHSIMRLRGLESGAGARYAEAFFCRKIVV